MTRRWPLVLALALAAVVLGWLLRPGGAAPEVQQAGTERHLVRLVLPVGTDHWRLEVDARDGRPAAVSRVTVEPVMTGMGHVLEPVPALPESAGRFRAPVVLPMSGHWAVTVRLHDGVDEEQAVFAVLR